MLSSVFPVNTKGSDTTGSVVGSLRPSTVWSYGRYQSQDTHWAGERLLEVGLRIIAALPNRDNRRRRDIETRPMRRQSRDCFIAVVHRDVMCLRGGRADAVQRAKRAAAQLASSSSGSVNGGWGVDKEPGSYRIALVSGLKKSYPDLPAPVWERLPIFPSEHHGCKGVPSNLHLISHIRAHPSITALLL